MTSKSVITEKMRKAIGTKIASDPPPEEVCMWSIKRYLEATTDENPLWRDKEYARKTRWGGIIAPPTYAETFNPANYAFREYPIIPSTSIGGESSWQLPSQIALPIKLPFSRIFEAFNQFEFFAPIRPGDIISCNIKLSDLYEKQSATGAGRMLFVCQDIEYRNQKKELVCITRIGMANIEGSSQKGGDRGSATAPVSAPKKVEQLPFSTRQVYFEDVEIGTEVPPLVKDTTLYTILKWGAASNDYGPPHFDYPFATQVMGLPNVVAHGTINNALLAQLMTNWIGGEGALKKHYAEMRGNVFPGDRCTFQGKVVKKYVQDGQNLVDCESWAENQTGRRVTLGRSTVTLPKRRQ